MEWFLLVKYRFAGPRRYGLEWKFPFLLDDTVDISASNELVVWIHMAYMVSHRNSVYTVD
ncbi:hypothetical protein BCR42DRAFT_404208 [Absidia repens]|uniref:Uncharacterized protein n=1 Tax=Absidia repens TaxID=90262 RepID=A0A1X2IW03_9FUNG|nr:hypothetical protein BCR42DRAFT_404208 [Absidia repens]